MQTKFATSLQSLKSIRPKDFIYPGASLVFLGIVIAIFTTSTRFISENVNKIFSTENIATPESLNVENYNLTVKKLNIKKNQSATPPSVDTTSATSTNPESEPSNVPTSDTASTTTSTPPPTTTTPQTEQSSIDKSKVTIAILNSTKKAGAASVLKERLTQAGFSLITTGNDPKLRPITTVIFKENGADYARIITPEILKTYPNIYIETTDKTRTSDVTVIIGTR